MSWSQGAGPRWRLHSVPLSPAVVLPVAVDGRALADGSPIVHSAARCWTYCPPCTRRLAAELRALVGSLLHIGLELIVLALASGRWRAHSCGLGWRGPALERSNLEPKMSCAGFDRLATMRARELHSGDHWGNTYSSVCLRCLLALGASPAQRDAPAIGQASRRTVLPGMRRCGGCTRVHSERLHGAKLLHEALRDAPGALRQTRGEPRLDA